MVRGSTAQTVDGKLRVRAPVFDVVSPINWCDLRAHIFYFKVREAGWLTCY